MYIGYKLSPRNMMYISANLISAIYLIDTLYKFFIFNILPSVVDSSFY